jgi:formamidopyrimidine-DNA glycosylase
VVFETDARVKIVYTDHRRFGLMLLAKTDQLDAHPLFQGLGPEPLSNTFNAPVLSAALNGKKTPIKAALLDQRVVAGLGNIYVSEALFRAAISPLRSAHTVPGVRAGRLVPAIQATLNEAIAAGGSSLRDYVQPDGELGYFQHAWKVYGREGEACERCPGASGCGLIRRVTQAGRSSFYCPRTQR